jgi:hypothetical protein
MLFCAGDESSERAREVLGALHELGRPDSGIEQGAPLGEGKPRHILAAVPQQIKKRKR